MNMMESNAEEFRRRETDVCEVPPMRIPSLEEDVVVCMVKQNFLADVAAAKRLDIYNRSGLTVSFRRCVGPH